MLGTASCGKADPDDYEYGQSIGQITADNNYIAGGGDDNGNVPDDNGGDDNGGGTDDNIGGGDDITGGFDDITGGLTAEGMDKWIEKLDAPSVPVEYAAAENKEFEEFIDKLFKDKVTADTLTYNFTVLNGDVYGVKTPSPATLGDAEVSDEAIEKSNKETKEEYDKLMSFENKPLTEEEYFTFLTLKTDYEMSLFYNDNYLFYEPFSPMRGFQSNIGSNFAEYRFDDKQDIEDYIEIENQMPYYVSQLCKYEDMRVEKGYGMQDAACDEVIEQCETFAADKDNHFLILEFDSKMDKLDFLSDAERKDFKERNKKAVIDSVIPSILQIGDCVKANKGKASYQGGLCNIEGGKEYYENYIIPYFGGCKFSAQDLIDIYDQRYNEDFSRMLEIYASNPDAYSFYLEKSATLFEEADQRDAAENINILMSEAMDEYPKLDKIPFKADYLSPAMEKIMEHTLAYYMSPARDDKDGNIIRVNGSFNDDMWVTLAHEGCPGHMYQNTYFQQTNPKPIRSDAYNLGYMEGWAVYSSYRTISEYDFKDTDEDEAIAEFCKIDKELGYMLYGRIDLGVNYEGWTEQDVADYMSSKGFAASYAGELMNTVVGDPGVYLSYSFSQFMMEGMRTWMEGQLGDKFDVVEFHKVILDAGPCQFEDLKFKLDEYLYEHQ